MRQQHPERQELEQFVNNRVPAGLGRWIEDHLRAGCASCQSVIDEWLPRFESSLTVSSASRAPVEMSADDPAWDGVFARLEERLVEIAEQRETAPPLVEELIALERARRRVAAKSQRFHTMAVCEALMERAFEEGFLRAGRALELTELALELSLRLDEAVCGRAVLHDLRAKAWGYLGNARRLCGDLEGASVALEMAARLLASGTADPLEEARILDFRASVLSDRGWFEEAAALLDEVIALCDEVRDSHRKGRALISQGLFTGYAGIHETAVVLLRRGLALINPQREPRLVLAAQHNLIGFLNDAGRCLEAQRLFELFRQSYAEFPDPWTAIRMRWLEGRIAAGLGHTDAAEIALRDVRSRFLAEGLGVDAALAMLDLATLYIEAGRTADLRALACEMLPIFVSRDVHQQAAFALAELQDDMEAGRVSAEGIEEIVSYLRRSRRNPLLAFRAA
jgi:tetratricopeptide (TPR) repeat protein